MVRQTCRIGFLAVVLAVWVGASDASAQVFGTFSWRMEPYCDIVTLTITQFPAGYTLDGNDNQCGTGKLASATGQALINPDGTVGIDFTIVTSPGGKDVHVAALISPASGSGTWTDSVGNSGLFLLGAPGAGSPRPLPASGVGPATITSVEIAAAAVGATQLATNAVTGGNVVDGSLGMADIADGPRAGFVSGDQVTGLTGLEVVVRSLTLTAPAAGRMMVNASGYFGFYNTAAGDEVGRCSITTGTSLDFSHLIIATDGGSTSVAAFDAWAANRGFTVPAGPFTVNLVCNRYSGTQDVTVEDTSLTAIFVAQ